MTYFQSPEFLSQLQRVDGLAESLYEVMSTDDISDLPIKALEALKTTRTIPPFPRQEKCEVTSNKHREAGNKAYGETKYKTALESYNKALLYAPKATKSMLLAYSNRSALYHQNKYYSASLSDIETCFNFNFIPDEIKKKLEVRKKDCLQKLDSEKVEYNQFAKEFFKFDVEKNPDIPCASMDVEVQFDKTTNIPKVVAAKDIDIGTILAIEPAFVVIMNPENHYVSCYYCQKLSLNLIPCTSCCYALYCDKKCKKRDSEMHRYECYLMEVLHSNTFGPYSRITLRTILKIKSLCSTWKEFNEASKCVGTERMERSTVKEIYDVNKKFSILCFLKLRDIKPGSLYQFSFMCGTLLHCLANVPFFISSEEDTKGLARMLMKVFLQFSNKIEISSTANDWMMSRIAHVAPNYGYFSFASKLNHACDANVLPVGLNNKLGLVALQPIKKGTELTISYVDHAYDHMHEPSATRVGRIIELARFYRVCHCAVCDGTWKFNHRKLTVEQKKVFKKWTTSVSETHILQLNSNKDLLQDAYKATCNALAVLQGMSHRAEHRQMYVKFRNLMCVFQFLVTRNCCPEDIGNFKVYSFRI